MYLLISFVVIAFAGCTRANPNFCCVTEAECSAAGVDELRPCRPGQACEGGECVAATCQTSVDCTSPDAPRCLNGVCVPGCELDDHCTGIVGHPYCLDGACVECKFSAQCPASSEICDPVSSSCRGCIRDDECASGVCIEADGVCAEDTDILYVTFSGTDAGTCTKTEPCQSVSYGVSQTFGTRRVVRLLGAMVSIGSAPLSLPPSVIIDGSKTTIAGATRPLFDVSLSKIATIEGVRLASTDGSPVVTVVTNGKLRLVDSTIDRSQLTANTGTIEVSRVDFTSSNLDCRNGTTVATSSDFDRSTITISNCALTLRGSRLGPGNGTVQAAGNGLLTIENNVFAEESELSEIVYLYSYAAGSTFRFNTVVNSSQVTAVNTSAVFCGAGPVGIDVTSNIFAYNATTPLLGCVARNSLFDQPGMTAASDGTNNVVGEATLFFKDRSSGDYHLPPGSPAIGIGEANLVDRDFDGKPRPMPGGSKPDVGAFEAP